ncbi:MAG: ABC transporter permease [Hyphomicrobiales bacterium]
MTASEIASAAAPARRRFAVPWKVVRILSFYGGLLLAWKLVADAEIWPSYTLPAPETVWDTLRYNAEGGQLWEAFTVTMQRMLIGFSVSILIGLTIGIAMGAVPWIDETVGSLVLGLLSLPSVTWFPLAVLWFGLNERAIVFVVCMGSLCSIAISARNGVRSIPPLLLRASRMFGGRTWQRLGLVILPAMLPSMVQGLKLGWSFAWRSLLAAELLYVNTSLGHLLSLGRDLNDVSQVIAIMLVIVAIGIVVDRVLFGRLEGWVQDRWGLA